MLGVVAPTGGTRAGRMGVVIADPLLVLEAGAQPDGALALTATGWPGVRDPDVLRAQLLDWLSQYANPGTRRTYAYALGLPVDWVDAIGAPPAPSRPGAARRPPPAGQGPLHGLAWFRWCAAHGLDPRAATSAHV